MRLRWRQFFPDTLTSTRSFGARIQADLRSASFLLLSNSAGGNLLRSGAARLIPAREPSPRTIRHNGRERVSRSAVLLTYLLCSHAAFAGQASGQFQVGITITGKPASPGAGSGIEPEPPVTAKPTTSGSAIPAKRLQFCVKQARMFDPLSGSYSIRRIRTLCR
jgi:hypothetical protein